MLKKGRAAALLLAVLLLLGGTPIALAEEETVRISTAEDLLDLSKRCSLDSWSRGRTVVLAADLSLGGKPFTPIPTFGGVFDGQGHTISGLRIAESGSSMGLFRTIQEGAVVKDLTVSGTVAPSGSASRAGAIAGVNRGSIQNCSVRGIVRGEGEVGGIAGRNGETGEISGCSANGQVLGSSSTGGIAGLNEGLLIKCSNSAEVNTNSPETGIGLEGLEIPQLGPDGSALDSEGLLSGHSDTGGIAGLSLGVIQSCVNSGTVGYPHVGYNVGGIAGRQSGYLSGCVNNGTVYGRKDVGGITGQAEPDIAILPGKETLERLQTELNRLENLIDASVSSTDAQANRISGTLSALGGYTASAKDNTNTLVDQTADFINGSMEQVNTLSAAVTDSLDHLSPALEILSGTSPQITDMCSRLEDVIDALRDAGSITQDAADIASRALGRMQNAGTDLAAAAASLQAGVQHLQNAVIYRDKEQARQALSELSESLSRIAGSVSDASTAFSDLTDSIHSGMVSRDAIAQLRTALATLGESARLAARSIASLSQNTSFDWGSLEGGVTSVDNAFGALYDAARSFASSMGTLRDSVDTVTGLSGPFETARGALLGALDAGKSVSGSLEQSFSGMQNAVDTLRRDGGSSFLPLGDTFHDASSGLYAAASGLTQELENLHTGVDAAWSGLSGNLQAINRQAGVVTDLLLDAINDLQEGPDTGSIISDSSDEDAAATTQGKISQCINNGMVEGDRNVGGIAGAMSIEYGLDPEDDVERLSLGNTYETRAVLQENISRGEITGKKDCIGGIAGRMDLGAVVGCQSYGGITSTSGSYVGGIAGWSESAIRGSYAKCILSGEDDIGGIAGWSTRMRGCQAIATIAAGRSRTGAVAGDADIDGGGVTGNRFVDTGTAGIDGVSYAGLAEPVTYETLCEEPGTPNEFLSFTLRLIADGEVTAQIPFAYGQDLGGITLPDVPEREGFYGRWPAFDTTGLVSDVTAEADYTPWAALVGSSERASEGGPSLALAGGQFGPDAVLEVRQSSQTPPPGGNEVWELVLTGTGLPSDTEVPIRLLDRSGGGTVWQYDGGQWKSLKAAANGQYLLLSMEGLTGIYCIVPAGGSIPEFLIPLAGAALLVLLLAILGKKLIKKRKTRKKAKIAETQSDK